MLLFTGFKPFLGQSVNSSWILAQELALEFPNSKVLELPVEFRNSFSQLRQYVKTLAEFPEKIFLLGQAQNRPHISIERVALNWAECDSPDEAGCRPEVGQIIKGEPAAFIQGHLRSFSKEKIKISHSAGTYVCNELYYRSLHFWRDQQQKIIFIHTPPLMEGEGPESQNGMGRLEQKKILLDWILDNQDC